MSKAHYIAPYVPQAPAQTVRLGTTGAKFGTMDTGKLVKLAAESQYNLVSVGDAIEGVVAAVESATSGGFAIGSIFKRGAIFAIADGLQATGASNLAVGDYVVAGTPVALGTSLSTDLGFARVRKATDQPYAAEAGALTNVNDMVKNGMFGWRVVSLGTAGTGAPGTQIVIERL
jgi:hypothetical protein